MVKYVCMHCEYTWDSETGDETYKVPAGPIEDFPDEWNYYIRLISFLLILLFFNFFIFIYFLIFLFLAIFSCF